MSVTTYILRCMCGRCTKRRNKNHCSNIVNAFNSLHSGKQPVKHASVRTLSALPSKSEQFCIYAELAKLLHGADRVLRQPDKMQYIHRRGRQIHRLLRLPPFESNAEQLYIPDYSGGRERTQLAKIQRHTPCIELIT